MTRITRRDFVERHLALGAHLVAALFALAPSPSAAQGRLDNGRIRADFGPRGLVALTDARTRATQRVTEDGFRIILGDDSLDSRALTAPNRRGERERVTYTWTARSYRLELVYELRPSWRFLSKQLFVRAAPSSAYRVRDVTVSRLALSVPPAEVFIPGSHRTSLQTADYGAALRLSDSSGVLLIVQNPFLHIERGGDTTSIRYAPEMEWQSTYGAFASDRALMAPYRLSGRRLPARMRSEWRMRDSAATPGMDVAEVAAFTDVVRAFLLYQPSAPSNVFVGWTANDYQIDVGTAAGRAEYKRVLGRAAELGARHVVYAPTNSALSRRRSSADYWSWEHVLWLGLGQRLRRDEWNPATGEIPPTVREMVDYADGKGLKLLAYVYPVLGFTQNPAWLLPAEKGDDKRFADLGVRALQDWLVSTLVTFHRRTGIGGYSFDHTFLGFPGTSRYAQWWGWRRVMEELRRQVPDAVVDGRQAYHLYGPWSWLAGSYPHPTMNDEQPESFVPFPDLHFDRVSADRERYTAYQYRNYEFAPSEIVPGYMTHQTPRSDDSGEMPEAPAGNDTIPVRFRARDWDYLGWRYSVLSSIAVGGWNNVLSMIPARDSAEFRQFSPEDVRWWRRWIEWTAEKKELLRRTRTILQEPALGRIDGTAAVSGDSGYVFLFNPNGRRLDAAVAFDSTIGLGTGTRFIVRELYPREGRLVAKPGGGVWSRGDRMAMTMDGGSAIVLEIRRAPAAVGAPVLFGATGRARLDGGVLQLTEVSGEVGTEEELVVALPAGSVVREVRVNGNATTFARPGDGAVTVRVRFAGAPFRHYQQLGAYDSTFTGGRFSASMTVPARVFDQLAARQAAWPIPWTPEDYRSTWLAPERLLLYVQIAEPDDQWDARLTIDGRTIELRKAYTAVRSARRTFVGFYADISLLSPDREHRIELELPALRAGQFQGLFVENVETEYTTTIAR